MTSRSSRLLAAEDAAARRHGHPDFDQALDTINFDEYRRIKDKVRVPMTPTERHHLLAFERHRPDHPTRYDPSIVMDAWDATDHWQRRA